MYQVYESFLRWLTLWLPYGSKLREHLVQATYDSLEREYWRVIAPYRFPDVPWDSSKFFEWRRSVYRPPTPMEQKIKSHQPDFDGIPF